MARSMCILIAGNSDWASKASKHFRSFSASCAPPHTYCKQLKWSKSHEIGICVACDTFRNSAGRWCYAQGHSEAHERGGAYKGTDCKSPPETQAEEEIAEWKPSTDVWLWGLGIQWKSTTRACRAYDWICCCLQDCKPGSTGDTDPSLSCNM